MKENLKGNEVGGGGSHGGSLVVVTVEGGVLVVMKVLSKMFLMIVMCWC